MIGSAARRVVVGARPMLRSQRWLSSEAATAPTMVKLNFCLPHDTIYSEKEVEQVIIPGAAGVYAVTAGHSPIVTELKPGVVEIIHSEGKESEKFFVSAGFALTHPTSVTDITAIEAVRVEELDEAAVKQSFDQFKRDMDKAAEGSRERAEAQIAMETSTAMGAAIGVNLS